MVTPAKEEEEVEQETDISVFTDVKCDKCDKCDK